VNNALVGFIEVKAPGKGADPRRFNEEHDKKQWSKLKTLPNLIYTDGNAVTKLGKADDFAGIVQQVVVRRGQAVLMSDAVHESHGLPQQQKPRPTFRV
jgi:hypothetical protein